jgi:predicted GNAT superfamily acetyltransferase
MKHDMELRKATWSAALRLAFVVSALAAIVAVTLSAAGDVPQGALVAAVMVVGFVASWIQTGRVARVHYEHHVAVVPTHRSETSLIQSAHSTSGG